MSDVRAPWLLCVGTRPEIIKMAPVYHALRAAGDRVEVLHTGQHDALAAPLYRFFDMQPRYRIELARDDDGLAALMAQLIARIGAQLQRIGPRAVLVHGDTLSALAGATAAFFARLPVAHVEAGLRTHAPYEPFPEEKNRELIARLATLHFSPTPQARANLLREGIDEAAIVVTGNTVVDAAAMALERLRAQADGLIDAQVRHFMSTHAARRLVLVTAHRRENWGAGIRSIAAAVAALLRTHPQLAFVWAVHANAAVAADVARGLEVAGAEARQRLLVTAPLDYPTLIAVLQRCWLVLSDSGGLQEEAVSLGVPILVLRNATERPELVSAGYGRLVGVCAESITAAVGELLATPSRHAAMKCPPGEAPFGDGRAAARICAALREAVPA